MESGKLISAVLGMILKVVVTILVIYFIYTGAIFCYDYGYRIFTEPAVSAGEGRQVTVTLTDDMSATEIGEAFAQKGLTKDARLLALQYLFSEFRKEITPGVYEVNTSMTAEEMFEAIAAAGKASGEIQEP